MSQSEANSGKVAAAASASTDGNDGNGGGGGEKPCDDADGDGGGPLSIPLAHPDDADNLSELFCFVRKQIEAFVVSPRIVDPRFRRMDGKIGVGRVGLRCVHCTSSVEGGGGGGGGGSRNRNSSSSVVARAGGEEGRKRPPTVVVPPPITRDGAVTYPKEIRLVYQSVRNWQRTHFLLCLALPGDVKERYVALKSRRGKALPKSRMSAGAYWERCCRRMGMVDTESGIQLRNGRFVVGDDWSDDCDGNDEGDGKKVEGAADVPAVSSGGEKSAQSAAIVNNTDALKISATGVQPAAVVNSMDALKISAAARSASEGSRSIGEKRSVTDQNDIPVVGTNVDDPSAGVNNEMQSENRTLLANSYNNAPDLLSDELETCLSQDMHIPYPTRKLIDRSPATYPCPAPFPLASDALFERLKNARDIVRAMRAICSQTKDEQSDLHSLGIALYNLFSGRQLSDLQTVGSILDPLADNSFGAESTERSAGDEDEWIGRQRRKRERRHDEGSYVLLSDLGLPTALSSVVHSLLSDKEDDDGYRSIQEVEEDLELMVAMPEDYLFRLPRETLHLTNMYLHGREREASELLEAFDRATSDGAARGGTTSASASSGACSNSNVVVLVTGYSGTGKSTLVRNVGPRFVERGACFVSGKFDAMRQPRPLSAIASAMNDYCDFLARDEGRIDAVREAAATAIGSEVKILADLIPSLRKIVVPLGDDPPVQVQGRGAFQRLLFAFRMLFWATCSTAHPVVFFLDDLQWADKVSLELMQVLVTDTMIEGLLFIGSYRDNEVGADHPLMAHLGNIRQSGCVSIVPMHLGNLDVKSIKSMVSDVLHMVPGTVRPLAEVVFNKTGGNALFAVQLLSSLHDEGLLRFSLTSRCWQWDIQKIRDKDIADNVVELMVGKMLRLRPEVQDALSVAACFGAMCQESLLRILDRAPDNVMCNVPSLDVAVSEGLMVKSDSAYRFSHDQIQLAAYLLISESDRAKSHLRIGRLLWKLSSAQELESSLFVVVEQLHRGSFLMTDPEERTQLSELSMLAGQMARRMSSFLPAAAYLSAGIRLLADNDWNSHRNLCFNLYNSCAEIHFILGEFDAARSHLEEVLRRAMTLQEKLQPHATLARTLSSLGLTNEAIDSCTVMLANLGESFPRTVTPQLIQQEIVATQMLLRVKSDEDLRSLGMMQYSKKLEAMKLLKSLHHCTSFRNEINPLITCRMVQLSLMHGICEESAFCFASYGAILCGHLNDFDGGYRFGRLGLTTMEKFPGSKELPAVNVFVYGLLSNWVEPLQSSLPCLEHAVDIGLATGDTFNAMVGSVMYVGTALNCGKPLDQLLERCDLFSRQIMGLNSHPIYATSKAIRQFMKNLLGRSNDPSKLIGDEVDGNDLLIDKAHNELSAQLLFYCMWLEYLFGHYDRAWETANKIEDTSKLPAGRFPLVCNYIFYSSLTALALARRDGRRDYTNAIDSGIAQMEHWARSTEWNCQHKLELMRAEYAYLQGDYAQAMKDYENAAKFASKHSFVHEQAVALERWGIFYAETGRGHDAYGIFARALECYNKWGAFSKGEHVREMYLKHG